MAAEGSVKLPRISTYSLKVKRDNGGKPTWRLSVVASQFSHSISNVVGIEASSIIRKHAARRRDSDAYGTFRGVDIEV